MSKAKYYIYRNLHTGGFSVKYRGRVVAHLDKFTAVNATFKVNEKGRQRVIKEKAKNVHAYIVTDAIPIDDCIEGKIGYKEITYNPYTDNSFHFVHDEKSVTNLTLVLGDKGRIYG